MACTLQAKGPQRLGHLTLACEDRKIEHLARIDLRVVSQKDEQKHERWRCLHWRQVLL